MESSVTKNGTRYFVYEKKTKDYIVMENGEKFFFQGEETDFNVQKSLHTGIIKNSKTGNFEFIKFIDRDDNHSEAEEWKFTNLKREGAFQFHYPYIEHVYGCSYGTVFGYEKGDCIKRNIFCVRVEYVEGKNLEVCRREQQKAMEAGMLSWEEFEREMFRQMLQFFHGMNYYIVAERRPYLTRDLKPLNVMIDKEGNVKIIDFDIAHIAGSLRTQMKEESYLIGISYGYTDPRTVNNKDFDIKTEIYSAGKTLFYWLNGKPYFNTDEEKKYYKDDKLAYGNEKIRYTERYQAEEFDDLRELIGKMCAEPESRYESIADIIGDLEAFLEKYYGGSEVWEKTLHWDEEPLLQKNKEKRSAINVEHRICKPAEPMTGGLLEEYAMRPISIKDARGHDVKVMTIYHLNGKVYYIPVMGGTDLQRVGTGAGFEIHDKDEFMIEDTKIRFKIEV